MRKRYGRDVGYYVCSRKGCKCNASTKKVNQKFEEWLDGISLPESCADVLRCQLERAFPILNRNGMEEVKAIRANLTKKQNEIGQIEYNLATAMNAKVSEICSKQLVKVEAERDEILRELEGGDNSILNLSDYVAFSLGLKDNLLKLW